MERRSSVKWPLVASPRPGNFTGVDELIAAVKDYLAQNNKQPKPFVWTAGVQQILDKVNLCKGISETLHQLFRCSAIGT
jgi:hypothetical protein